MVSASPIANLDTLHLDSIPPWTKDAFLSCIELPFLKTGNWYLAGGTALSLQRGHRQSVDLDFFTPESTFDEAKMAESFAVLGPWKTTSVLPTL